MSTTIKIKPMPFWQTLLYFGIPTLYFYLSIYTVLPYLGEKGVEPIVNYSLTLVLPVAVLLVASIVAFRLEGNQFTWAALKERFRLKPIKSKEWIWLLALIVFMILSTTLLSFTQTWLLKYDFFTPPDYLPSTLDPRIALSGIPQEFALIPLWGLALYQLIFFFFNIVGEEFWWRGYILPRQELVHGKYTWLVHGILWTLFHIFWKWNLIMILPGAVALSFVTQRLRNTSIPIVAHFLVNTVGSSIILIITR